MKKRCLVSSVYSGEKLSSLVLPLPFTILSHKVSRSLCSSPSKTDDQHQANAYTRAQSFLSPPLYYVDAVPQIEDVTTGQDYVNVSSPMPLISTEDFDPVW